MTELNELRGMTPAIQAKFEANNICTVERLAQLSLAELKEKAPKGTQEETLKKLQLEAWKKLNAWFVPANKIAEQRTPELILTTGCEALDDLLHDPIMEKDIKGGLRSRTITEFVGKGATGKTEVVHTVIAENLKLHPDWSAIVFDTESTFSEKRLASIAMQRGADPESILSRTLIVPVFHTQHFEVACDQADTIIKTRNVKIIAVDSIVGTIRAERIGRGELAERQQTLNRILRNLLNYAKAYNLVVLVTNQVSDKPDMVFSFNPEDLSPPSGGNMTGHNDNHRIYVRKASGKGQVRVARLIDSNCFPPGERPYQITSKGIEDIDGWKEITARLEAKNKLTVPSQAEPVPPIEGEDGDDIK